MGTLVRLGFQNHARAEQDQQLLQQLLALQLEHHVKVAVLRLCSHLLV